MSKIEAPWSDEQVKNLNDYQDAGYFHPFTCPGDQACEERNLIATQNGWVCQCGKYTQDWAHEFMARPLTAHPFFPTK